MTPLSRRSFVIGLCVLIMIGTHSPISAAAAAPEFGDSATVSGVPNSSAPSFETTAAPVHGSDVEPTSATTTSGPSPSYALLPDKFALEVSPSRLTIGQADIQKVQTIQVVNRGQSAQIVTVQKRNFLAGPDGSFVYQANAPYAASQWVTVKPALFTMAPGETQVVTTTVKVPAKPEPGDHQVALVFLVPAGKSSGNIKINRGIAAPVFITVPGAADNSVALAGFSVPHFVSGGPVAVTAQVENTGTVHRDFRGASPLRIGGAGTAGAF